MRTVRIHEAARLDADNAQAAVIEGLLADIARTGEATVKRIYGDFTAPTSSSWKKVLQRYAIKPVQQFAYSTGKNATDSTLIIDAMDLRQKNAKRRGQITRCCTFVRNRA